MTSGTENKFLDAALKLQKMGFRIFPLIPGRKLPLLKGYTPVASSDPEKAALFWRCPLLDIPLYNNIGVSSSRLADGRKLIVLDIDMKDGHNGDDDLLRFELEGKDLPDTYEQRTPSGGRHLVYWTTASVGNSVKRFAPGIDTRGKGGLFVGAGSEVAAGTYTANFAPIAEAPEWLIKEVARRLVELESRQVGALVDQDYAETRAASFLLSQPGAVAGSLSARAYELACRLKDFGVSAYGTFELMSEHWAGRCEPPIADDDLIIRVDNAYRHGKEKPGVGAPENAFDEIADEPEPPPPPPEEKKLSPIQELNRDHAFIMAGAGHLILWETQNSEGQPVVRFVAEPSFHRQYLQRTMINGENKMEPVTKVWMRSDERRDYNGLCFRPQLKTPPGWYNLWRGFTVEPMPSLHDDAPKEWLESLDMFLQHARENICDGDAKLFHWLMGYFAHFVQFPSEKPLVALVFRGRKGVGKNALIERVGHLVGGHYTLASDARYLLGNFNSHLENCLLFVLDEAFWSGDKKAEGRLKDLITGTHHNIERKGLEPYKVENCTRVVIIGNEDWIVPATHDERRFAVFNVGEKRKRDNAFFKKMIRGMEAGGYRMLLRYLMDYDFSDIDVNEAPMTKGLLDQKLESMGMIDQWWHECLNDGEIVASEIQGWPEFVSKQTLRDAFARYARDRNNRSRIPDSRSFGHAVHIMCSSTKSGKRGTDNVYYLPPLEKARMELEKHVGHELTWD